MFEFTVYGQPYIKKSGQRTYWAGDHIRRVNTPSYKQWHKDALIQLKFAQKPAEPISAPSNLQVRFFMKNAGRCDLSALYEGIQDVLVEIGILADDNWKIVASHDGSGVEVDREEPRMEIKITPKQ
jgi:Holliday junction resolvase RusA-like endonuclease